MYSQPQSKGQTRLKTRARIEEDRRRHLRTDTARRPARAAQTSTHKPAMAAVTSEMKLDMDLGDAPALARAAYARLPAGPGGGAQETENKCAHSARRKPGGARTPRRPMPARYASVRLLRRCLDTRPMLCPALQRARCDAQGRFLLGSPRIRSRGD